jgi:hypothetical protein
LGSYLNLEKDVPTLRLNFSFIEGQYNCDMPGPIDKDPVWIQIRIRNTDIKHETLMVLGKLFRYLSGSDVKVAGHFVEGEGAVHTTRIILVVRGNPPVHNRVKLVTGQNSVKQRKSSC